MEPVTGQRFRGSRFGVRAVLAEEMNTLGAVLSAGRTSADRTADPSDMEAIWWRDHWPRFEPARPGFSLEHHRVGVLDGRPAAYIGVRPCTLTYGQVNLKVAALSGFTGIHPEYDELGYGQAVIQNALTYAAEQRAHLAMIHLKDGDHIMPDTLRHSFHSVMPVYYAEFDAGQMSRLRALLDDPTSPTASSLLLRSGELHDAPYLAAMFERYWSGRLTTARSPDLWLWRMPGAESARRALVVTTQDGQPQGYISGTGQDDLHLLTSEQVEVIASTPEAALTLLAAAGEAALRRGQMRVRWLMPPDDGLIALARRYIEVRLSAQYSPSAGWRARVLNGEALVKALMPELTAQLRLTGYDVDHTRIQLEAGAEGFAISQHGAPQTFSYLHQSDFVQLLFGAVSPHALAVSRHEGLSDAAIELLQALFPPRVSAFGAWDWF